MVVMRATVKETTTVRLDISSALASHVLMTEGGVMVTRTVMRERMRWSVWIISVRTGSLNVSGDKF